MAPALSPPVRPRSRPPAGLVVAHHHSQASGNGRGSDRWQRGGRVVVDLASGLQQESAMSHNGITVAATGTASGAPDRAVLTLGASAVRGDVAGALAVVKGKLESLTSILAE